MLQSAERCAAQRKRLVLAAAAWLMLSKQQATVRTPMRGTALASTAVCISYAFSRANSPQSLRGCNRAPDCSCAKRKERPSS
eukprot:16994-Heterococcus_DN1.PRE.3